MAVLFLDTSALVRRYDRAEPASARVRSACAPARGNALLLARLAPIELASALARKTRDGVLDPVGRARLWRLFQAHRRDQYRLVELTDEVYTRAEHLLFRHRLRAFDAAHLACALVVATTLPAIRLEFWTADRHQAQAATGEGLTVELIA